MAATLDFWSELFSLFFIYKPPRCFLPSFKSIGLLDQEKNRKIDFQDGGHLGYPIGTIFFLFMIYKSPRCVLLSFRSFGLSVQEKKWKIDFQSGGHGCHLRFLIWTILAIFDLQVSLMLPTKFQFNLPFGSGEEVKIDFQDGGHRGHLGFTIETILAIFHLQVSPMLPTKFQVNWPFCSEEEARNRFSRWGLWQPSWIPHQNDFSYFSSTSHPDASYQVSSKLA